MADSVRVELITRDFNRMLEDLASIDPKIEFRDIVRAVAVRVIAGALRRTRVATVEKIRNDYEEREWITFEGKKYNIFWYLHNDSLYNRMDSYRKNDLRRRLDSRGLAKQSWLHQARDLGGTIEVPAYVDRANYKGKQYPVDASHRESGGAADYALTILNSSPIVQGAGGRAALIAAMAGETRYFYQSLDHGAFKTAERRTARYPGVFVTPRPSG